ncbi:MAG: hypothetical protein RLZZ324_1268 [Candidatus Parcubacteria bacterium]|jgi:hypothetical protein
MTDEPKAFTNSTFRGMVAAAAMIALLPGSLLVAQAFDDGCLNWGSVYMAVVAIITFISGVLPSTDYELKHGAFIRVVVTVIGAVLAVVFCLNIGLGIDSGALTMERHDIALPIAASLAIGFSVELTISNVRLIVATHTEAQP